MREHFKTVAAVALLIALAAMPLGGGAAGLPRTGTVAQCYGFTQMDGAGTCTTTFTLTTAGFVSNLETHAHFHQFIADIGPTRFTTLEWQDGAGETVYSSFCQDRGGSLADTIIGQEIGPSDLQNVACASVYHKTTYVPGEQTLIATGDMVPRGEGFKFHGKLFVSSNDSLI